MRYLVLAVCAAIAASALADEPKPKPKNTENTELRKLIFEAHNKRGVSRDTFRQLDQLIISGRATPEERKQFTDIYTKLRALKPPQGTVESWQYDIDCILSAAKAIYELKDEGDSAAAARGLARLTNCTICHEKYRYNPEPDPNESVPKSLDTGLKAIAAGGKHWSSPPTLKPDGSKIALQPGRRLIVWPAEDVVYEAKRGNGDFADILVKFKWALRPGAEFPPSESKILWYVTDDLGEKERPGGLAYYHAKPDMNAREGEFTAHISIWATGRAAGEYELVFIPQYSSMFSDQIAASNFVKLKYRLPK